MSNKFKVMEFFLLSKKPFTEKRDINWRKVKIVLGAMIAALVFALLLLPEEEQLGSFAEVSNKDSEMKSEAPNYYDDPNTEAIKYFKTSNLGSVPRSLGHNYQSGVSSANNRNDSMIINRGGANAKNELSAGHRILVSLLDRIVISNHAMPVRAKVVENIASDNYLAIEAQSVLIGDATFDEANGLAQITWKTIIYPNGVQRSISASGANFEELDRPYNMPKVNFSFFDIKFSGQNIITSKEITKQNHHSLGASMYIITPLIPSLKNTLGIFIAVFFFCILISFLSARQMRKAIKIALTPLNQLHDEIKGMVNEGNFESTPIRIKELDAIRSTVNSTKIALANAKDKLAESKAKKLSSDSYKRLIHDLHNPVAALRQMAKLSNSQTEDQQTRQQALSSIPSLADQILNQVTAANKNLEEEIIALRDLNLVDCIQESINQVKSLKPKKEISFNLPAEGFSAPHDPTLLKRAIINLVENGIDAAKNKVRVSITKNNEFAFIRVCDDGPGIQEDKISQYFQGRGQSGKANRQAFGLSTTNHIVRSHGGKLIHRKSDLGGSSFEIRLGVI